MKKIGFLAFVALTITGIASAGAQSSPKREKCLLEAQAKGLFEPVRGRGYLITQRANAQKAPQRRAFMTECMKRP